MKLAIFDFDGTLFPKDTLPFLLRQWKMKKYSRRKYIKTYVSEIFLYFKYKFGMGSNLSREQIRSLAIQRFNRIFEGMSEQEVWDFFDYCSKEIQGLLNESIIVEVNKARLNGYHTVLLSGSYEYLLNSIGKYLEFDSVIGTKIYFKEDKFDLSRELEVASGESKLRRINEKFESINWNESLAYADSYSDIHILKAVGQPVAVNPDTKLKVIADEMKWRII